MRKTQVWCALALAITTMIVLPSPAQANGSALKPYVVLILDTSGSMEEGTGRCSVSTTTACSTATVANDCPAAETCVGSTTPTCGGNDTKLDHARCAISRIVASYGDIVFALGRFRMSMSGTTTAATFPTGCSTSQPNCSTADNQAELLSGLVDGNNAAAHVWTNLTGNTCTATGSDPEIWLASGSTPIEGSLKATKRYWQGLQATDASTIWPAANPGFAPIFNDPLKNTFLPSGEQCRPYITILLTDGDETCGGNPANGAATLLSTTVGPHAYRIQTKPIGFGITPPPVGNCGTAGAAGCQIEDIAHAGGAVNTPGKDEGFYASNEAGLELAISTIIEGSLRFETCNNLDDDCDGKVDEDFKPPQGQLGLTCDNGKQGQCHTTGVFVCSADGTGVTCNAPAGPNPTTEICNGLDDDCDGKIDEDTSGCSCVVQAETCNNMDDDCDGKIDEGITRACGTGVCLGTETCVAGAFVGCTAVSPTTEVCNGLDDDCDGIIDGFTRECSTIVSACNPAVEGSCPASDNPGTTAACIAEGTKCACHPGDKTCPAGGTGQFGGCIGEIKPVAEVCNGLDDDCDGTIDEGFVGQDCSSNCGIGITQCVNGVITCNAMATGTDDTCNGIDDDCDGNVDEGYVPVDCGVGQVCGGMTKCVNGQVVCDGSPINPETCNCLDDDCDGTIDEDANCPGGATCTNCQCAFPCNGGEFPCPLGKACVAGFCIADPCFQHDCPDMNGNKQICTDVNNAPVCVDACSVANCAPLVCIPATGECKPDDCSTFPDRCTADQSCVAGVCVTNLCKNVNCPTDQYCSSGNCIQSCVDVSCSDGQRCRLGMCEPDPCGHPCPFGQVCNVNTDTCGADPCQLRTCPGGQTCNPEDGQCEDDPCKNGTTCPDPTQTCSFGTCDFAPVGGDGGPEAHVTTGGGGGCSTSGGNAGLMLGLAALLLRRRKGARA